jgi:photosystem II stability/assembly factor-like uncharacterized protein
VKIRRFSAVDENIAWSCGIYSIGQSGSNCSVIKKTTDGSNWITVFVDTRVELWDISAVDSNEAWAIGAGNYIIRTTDGGKSWSQVELVQPRVEDGQPEIAAIGSLNVWILDAHSRVLRTEDGGRSWCHFEVKPKIEDVSEENIGIDHFLPCSREVCWVTIGSGSTSFIYRTLDGGETWGLTSDRSFYLLGLIEARGPYQAFILVGKEGEDALSVKSNMLLATFDGGRTWSKPWLHNVTGIDLVDETTLWAVLPGTPRSKVLVTRNAGRTWTSHYVDIPLCRLVYARDQVRGLYLPDENDIIFSGGIMIGPGVNGINGSSAWVTGETSRWSATARTTDGGSHWTYCNE